MSSVTSLTGRAAAPSVRAVIRASSVAVVCVVVGDGGRHGAVATSVTVWKRSGRPAVSNKLSHSYELHILVFPSASGMQKVRDGRRARHAAAGERLVLETIPPDGAAFCRSSRG